MSIQSVIAALTKLSSSELEDFLDDAGSAGLDFLDPEDRASFRWSVAEYLKSKPIEILYDWFETHAPGMSVPKAKLNAAKLLADLHMGYKKPAVDGWVRPGPGYKPKEGVSEDVTSQLSRTARDAGFTLTRTPVFNSEDFRLEYEFNLLHNGKPAMGYGSKALQSIAEADRIAVARAKRM